MKPEQAKLIHDDQLALYRHIDSNIEKKLAHTKHTPSCSKGCDSCCKIMTLISLSEAVTMAWPLLQKPDWRELLPKLRESAQAMSPIGLSELEYALQRRPCVFLRDAACSMYSTRPGACRTYLVMTPKEQCDASNSREISSLDTLHEKAVIMGEGIRIFGDHIGSVFAPLPLMVLHAFRLMVPEATRPVVDAALKGLPNPAIWIQAKMGETRDRISPEEEVQARAALQEMGVMPR